MPAAVDLSGQRFGRLVVLRPVGLNRRGQRLWLCRCDCGSRHKSNTSDLRSGNTRSCGCLHTDQRRRLCAELASRRGGNPIHGKCYTPEYHVWRMMKNRCFNPRVARYEIYGGRGITVCERWLTFANFYADMGPRPEGVSAGGRALFSIERIDNDGNYEPGNCVWATSQQQSLNKRERTGG